MSIHPASDAEVAWVISRWVESEMKFQGLLRGTPGRKELAPLPDKMTASSGISKRAATLIRNCDALVAGAAGGEPVGFSVTDFRRPVVHYVYVSKEHRHRGIGLRLLTDIPRSPWAFTHRTQAGMGFVDAIGRRAGLHAGRFDPYLLDGMETLEAQR